MASRSIKVKLQADVDDFKRQMASAGDSLDGITSAAGRGERSTERMSTRIARSARENSQAWTTVGTSMLAAGAAMGVIGVAVAKTGIEYNSLRQTATMGLTAVTGSTAEAAEQMKRLDDYGQNSWLMRDSLIRAQQQMTGFGIETDKVIPYMDALAEATAATGGNNQDFEDMAFIMSKIAGQGKITAQELNEFGMRGVDAATLIGAAMGKTGGQIREEITAGALDADVALDALAEGMVMKYEGASDLVRNTFSGAVDDVEAAFRDLSAVMTSGLVDPEGGGALVTMLNSLGDMLRVVAELPPPLLQVAGGFGALATAGLLAGGAFLTLTPRLVATWDALGELGRVGQTTQGVLRRIAGPLGRIAAVGAAVGVTAVAAGVLAKALHDPGTAYETERIADKMQNLVAAGRNLADIRLDQIFERMPTFLGATTVEAETLAEALEQVSNPSFTDQISKFAGEFLLLPSYMVDSADAVGVADDALAHMAEGSLPMAQAGFAGMAEETDGSEEAIRELLNGLPGYEDALYDAAAASGITADESNILAIAMGQLDIKTGEATGATGVLAEGLAGLAEGFADTSTGFIDSLGAWDAAIEKQQELAQTAADSSGDASASWEDFYDGNTVSISGYLDELQMQVDAQEKWQRNMVLLSGRVSDGTLAELERLGPEGAPLVAALVDASDEELGRFEELMVAGSAEAGEAFAAGFLESIPLMRYAMNNMSDAAIAELSEGLASGEMTVQEALDEYDLVAEVDGDTGQAVVKADDFERYVYSMDPTWMLKANAYEARQKAADEATWVEQRNPVMNIYGDPSRASGDIDQTATLAEQIDPYMRIFGNPTSVNRDVTDTMLGVTTARPYLRIFGDDNPAVVTLDSLGRVIRWTREDMKVGADMDLARTTTDWFRPANKSIKFYADMDSVYSAVRNYHPSISAQISPYMRNMATGGAVEGYAFGGAVRGPGTGTSDSIMASAGVSRRPIRLSNGEHVWTDAEVRAAGGHAAMYAMRSAVKSGAFQAPSGYADGGAVRPAYQPAPITYQTQQRSGSSGPVTAVLAVEDRALLTAVAERPVQMRVDRRVLAESTANASSWGHDRGQAAPTGKAARW